MRNIAEPGLPVSTRYFAWDEANRLKAVNKANALVQHHLYDANGERSHKGTGNLFYMGINGGPQGYDHYIGNYQLYPSGYLTVGEYDLVTKHYYTGTQRIASRLAGDVTDFHAASEQAEYGEQTAGLKDRQKNDIYAAFDQFKLSHPAIWNVPGMAPPCNQGEEEDELCLCVFNHQCGTGPIYFFHSDHLGSSTFLTDGSGQPYQFFLNLPFGETMEEQFALASNAWWKTPYFFNGKELDSKTSLYYYGARYYDPGLSVWLSVDKLADHPNQVDKSPYSAFWSNPISYNDPDGNCPQCIVGFAIGFSLDIATQMLFEGKSLSEVNYMSATISGAAGALSGGISSVAKLSRVAQISANIAIDASESVGKQVIAGDDVNLNQVASDVLMGGIGRKAKIFDDVNVKVKENTLDRAERIVADRVQAGKNVTSGRIQNVKNAQNV